MKIKNEKYYQITKCLFCGKEIYDLRVKNRKYCCVSHQSQHKYLLNPELRKISSKNGKIALNKINIDGRAFRMTKGYHTQEFKDKISKLMKNKIGENIPYL